jgi:pimeloyl-ACP methyl ester carboxylesterase
MELVTVDGVELEVQISGSGEPIVLIQTALSADELRPLSEQPPVREGYRTILYHRRGYGASSPAERPGSVARDAADCLSLLTALDVGPAHVVGVSYSAAVALHLASWAPTSVHTLTVLEPPPVHIPSAPQFRAANARLAEIFHAEGAIAALDEFLTMLVGPDWRAESERRLTGSVAQMERDATTFFATDLPALLAWEFDADEAARIGSPVVLHRRHRKRALVRRGS